jgi:hypothetical protein
MMNLRLNTWQRVAAAVAAMVIGGVQTIAVIDHLHSGNGVSGFGWVFGYLTAGTLALIALNGQRHADKQAIKIASPEKTFDRLQALSVALSNSFIKFAHENCYDHDEDGISVTEERKRQAAMELSITIITAALVEVRSSVREYAATTMLSGYAAGARRALERNGASSAQAERIVSAQLNIMAMAMKDLNDSLREGRSAPFTLAIANASHVFGGIQNADELNERFGDICAKLHGRARAEIASLLG